MKAEVSVIRYGQVLFDRARAAISVSPDPAGEWHGSLVLPPGAAVPVGAACVLRTAGGREGTIVFECASGQVVGRPPLPVHARFRGEGALSRAAGPLARRGR